MIFRIVLGCCTSWLGHSGNLHPLLKHLFYGLMVTRRRRCLRPPMHLARRPLHQHRRQSILEVVTVATLPLVLLRGRLWPERFDSGLLWLVVIDVVKDCNFDFVTACGLLFLLLLLLGGSGGGAGRALFGCEGQLFAKVGSLVGRLDCRSSAVGTCCRCSLGCSRFRLRSDR